MADDLDINKITELFSRKYHWPSFKKDVEAYVKDSKVCLSLKAVKHKLYNNFSLLLMLTYWWKNFLIDFVTGLLISTDKKRESYNSILVIINRPTKIIYYKPIKVIINTSGLAKIIFNMVICYYKLPNSIIINKSLLFISKFLSLLYYFPSIKQKFSIAFYL